MNNIWLSWGDVFNASLRELWFGFIQFTPKFVIAVVLFMVGWLLGNILARALEQVFGTLKVDSLFKSVGADDTLRKAGMSLDSGHFVGQVAKWFVVVVFLLPSLDLVFGANNSVSGFLNNVLAYLPNVIVAAFILIIATVVSEGLSKAATATAKSMSLSSANMLGAIAKYSVWVFALIIALGQLGVASGFMDTLFTGIVFMLSLGGALAFGLGGKEHASRFLSKLGEEVSSK
jgi:small-conductance mechanosensitive channel